jgi:predicted Zn-dependent peptidase
MFGGSVNIPSYDGPLQDAGGENNAFTTNDITNYYLTLPAQNIETAFWLESDRMLSLAFTPESLRVQRRVVVEEFRQRYINQPYGDAMHILRSMIYKKHPYRWPTIGLEPSHIEKATLKDVKDFFRRWYHPANAIMTVAGNVKTKDIQKLAEKWFGPIPAQKTQVLKPEAEPIQRKMRIKTVTRDVPYPAVYLAYGMPGRLHPDYHACDLISDVLGNGKSSRLWKKLVIRKPLFSDIGASISGSMDPGFILIDGTLNDGKDPAAAVNSIREIIDEIKNRKIPAREMEKLINRAESTILFQTLGTAQIALSLAVFESLGDATLINREHLLYRSVTREKLQDAAIRYLSDDNCSLLYYLNKRS